MQPFTTMHFPTFLSTLQNNFTYTFSCARPVCIMRDLTRGNILHECMTRGFVSNSNKHV